MNNAETFFRDNLNRIAQNEHHISDPQAYNSNHGMIELAQQLNEIQSLLNQIDARLRNIELLQSR